MSSSIDRTDVVWIVVSSSNHWGAANSLYEAMKNAQLYEPMSAAQFFADELEYVFDVAEANKNWTEYGKDDCQAPSGEVHTILVYKFDPALWTDYSVSPIDGSVSFFAKEDIEFDRQAEMDKAVLVAEYRDGVLTPKSK